MSTKQEAYRRMLIKAQSFKLSGTKSYITSLTIVEATHSENAVVEIPVTHLLSDDEDRALEETLAHGRLLVDGLAREAENEALFKKLSLLKPRSSGRRRRSAVGR